MDAERIQLKYGMLRVDATPPEFPLGGRGERPFKLTLTRDEDITHLKAMAIPGVTVKGKTVTCAFDALTTIGLEIEDTGAIDQLVKERENAPVPLPGLEEYTKKLKPVLRDYQRETVRFALRRAYTLVAEVPRAGKTLCVLATIVLSGSKKCLVLSNSLGKYVWAAEVAKWLGEEVVILFGRSCDEARIMCIKCVGRGMTQTDVKDKNGVPELARCTKCRGKSERILRVRELESKTEARVWFEETGKLKKDGTPKMQRRSARYSILPQVFTCSRHKDEIDSKPRTCTKCREELNTVLSSTRIILGNYEVMQGQSEKDDRGVERVRDDLPGWGPILASQKFDTAVLSEAHRLRGWQPKTEAKKTVRRERVDDVVYEIPRVIAETGTPTCGYVRDFFGLLDILSRGLWS